MSNVFEKLPKLGFGAMRLPQTNGKIDQPQFNEMVRYAMDQGINYFDTSFVYHGGNSEVALGIALEPFERSSYYLADKMSFWGANSEDFLDNAFKTSCEKLKTDYIDFYLMHSMNDDLFDKVKKLNAIEWALKKKQEGKIKYLGFSIHADYECLIKLLDHHKWDFVQMQYNYMDLDDNPGQRGYNELVARGIPIIIMEPLKGGVLSDIPEHIAEPYKALGKTNVEMSFRWLAELKGVVTILSGMSNPEQLKQNIEIFKNIQPLNAEEHAAISQVKKNIEQAQKVPCTGCSYCMPCPYGINIPETFKAWNLKSMQQNDNWISGADVDNNMLKQCAECGQCTSHCPQTIDVPNMFKKLLAEA